MRTIPTHHHFYRWYLPTLYQTMSSEIYFMMWYEINWYDVQHKQSIVSRRYIYVHRLDVTDFQQYLYVCFSSHIYPYVKKYIYVYIHTHVYVYIYIHIYRSTQTFLPIDHSPHLRVADIFFVHLELELPRTRTLAKLWHAHFKSHEILWKGTWTNEPKHYISHILAAESFQSLKKHAYLVENHQVWLWGQARAPK